MILSKYNLFLAHLFFGYIHFFRFLYNPDPCNPNPCQNGGTCNPHGPGTVTCNCPPHCAGLACEICEGNCRFLQHKNWYVNLNFVYTPWPMNYLSFTCFYCSGTTIKTTKSPMTVEKCCQEGYVTEHCMGLCRRAGDYADFPKKTACEKFKPKINRCWERFGPPK